MVITACTGSTDSAGGINSSNQTDNSATYANNTGSYTDASVTVPDSMPEDMEDSEPKVPQIPQISFATTQDALEYMTSSADATKYAEGILPQMAEDELSYAEKLLNNQYDKFLIIDKQLMRVGLFDKFGREILSYGIACARNYGTKHKRADSRTPEGFFSVEGIYNSTDWLFTDDNGRTSKRKGQFGPRFIRIKNPVSTQIGLHGTCSPGSIGSRSSHGCIRVTNDHILELVKYVTPGMPVIISPSARDKQVNDREGYDVAMITMDPYGKYQPSWTGQSKEKTDKKQTNSQVHTETGVGVTEIYEESKPGETEATSIPDTIH
ncbi:MAG: L,D-transpeptidase [Prevotella sp.]|nr:L,D-transpeptidase [Prevotella sp.]MCM1075306.1 L,D-transpeptidase [Ruminococcus sp.]